MSRGARGGSARPIVIGSETQIGSQDIRPGIPVPTSPAQLITLTPNPPPVGADNDAKSVVALCGANAPTITGGYAKWAVIDRPQRIGMTVFQGFDPMVLTIDLMMDQLNANAKWHLGLLPATKSEPQVEYACALLDYMAGRGYLNGARPASESPLVTATSTISVRNTGGKSTIYPTGLIPANARERQFVVTGLTFDQNPLHSEKTGVRVRQQATVVLTQYIDSPGSHLDSSAYRQALTAADGTQYQTFKLTRANNTILKITVNLARNSNFAAAQAVLAANKQGNAQLITGRSVREDLTKHNALGTPVRVPQTVIDGLV